MRNLKKLLAVIVSVCVLATFALPAFAAETTTLTDAQISEKLGAVKGDTSQGVTDEYLAKGTTRLQAAIIYLRMLNLEEEALAFESEDNFADAADVPWAGGRAILAYLKANPELGWQGVSETTFEPNGAASAQMMYKVALEALGYKQGTDFEWADVFTFAEDKGLGKAADLAELTNNDMCTIVVEMLGIKVKDGDMTLIEKLVADGVVTEEAAVAVGLVAAGEALDVSGAVAINSKVVEVALDTAATAKDVAAATFVVKDADGKEVAVASAELAAYNTDNKAVLVFLGADTTAGTIYSLSAGEKSVNFGGVAVDKTKPELSTVVSTDYNEVKVTFSEAVKLEGASFVITEKYGTKATLDITNMKYGANNEIVLTTSEQKGATLYGIEVSNVKDFADLAMDKDTDNTFVGTAKDTSDLKVAAAGSNDPEEAVVKFNVKVDAATIAPENFKVEEMYGSKAVLPVTAARIATKDDKDVGGLALTDTTAKSRVIITVPGTKNATLYKVTVSGMSSAYGKGLSSTSDDQFKTFVGTAKPSDAFGFGATPVTTNSNTSITVSFARKVDKALAEDIANYAIVETYGDKAALTVTKAELQSGDKSVKLTVSSMKNVLYKLTVSNLKDIYGNAIKTDSDANKTNFVGQAVQDKISSFTIARVDDTHITLTFNKNVGTSLKDVSHYFIDGDVGYPSKAEAVENQPTQVKLTIPKTTEGKIYKLTVKGLENADGVAMDSAGISNTFVGKGNAVGLVTIDGIATIDKNAFEIFFDRAVDGNTVKNLIWDGSTNKLGVSSRTDVVIKKGSGSYAAVNAAHIVYKDPLNDKGLIVRYTSTSDIQSSTGEVVTIKFTSPFIKDASSGKEYTFASSNSDPAAPKLVGTLAENKHSVLLYFDQPMNKDTVVKANIDIIDAKGAGSAVEVLDGVSEVQKVDDTTFRYFTADLTAPATATADDDGLYYIRLSSSVTNAGGVAIAKESDSDSNHYAMLGISTASADDIDNIYAVMTDKRTIEVYYPTSMENGVPTNPGDVLNVANYAIVDSDNASITGAPAIKWVKYDAGKNKAILYLGGDLPASAKGHYLVISKNINTLITGQNVKEVATYGALSGVRTQVALSTTDAAAPKLASATVSPDKKTMTVKFENPVAFMSDGGTVALGTTPAIDTFVLNGSAAGSITATQFFSAIKVTATLTVGGEVTLMAADTTGTVALAKDGKTAEFTLATGKTFAPSTSGKVSTDVAMVPTTGVRVVTGTLVAQKTGDDKSEVAFGVESGYAYDFTAPVVVDAAFTDATTLVITFDEAVNAALTDFTPGAVTNTGSGSATTFTASAITGSGTNVITLTVAGDVALEAGDTAEIAIGAGVKDLNGNAITTGPAQAVAAF